MRIYTARPPRLVVRSFPINIKFNRENCIFRIDAYYLHILYVRNKQINYFRFPNLNNTIVYNTTIINMLIDNSLKKIITGKFLISKYFSIYEKNIYL